MRISFQVPDPYVSRIRDAVIGLHPIPCDPKTMEPLFSSAEWVRECLRRMIRNLVVRYERKHAAEVAQQAVSVPEDIVQLEE